MAERSPLDYGDRLGRLEGIIEQINDRLGSLERRMSSLEGQMSSLRSDLEGQMSSLRSDLEAQIGSLRNDLERRIEQLGEQPSTGLSLAARHDDRHVGDDDGLARDGGR